MASEKNGKIDILNFYMVVNLDILICRDFRIIQKYD